MAKVITSKELLAALAKMLEDVDDADTYGHILEEVAQTLADHTGCEVGAVSRPEEDLPEWTVAFHAGPDALLDFWAEFDPDGDLEDDPMAEEDF
jgi:hypothetical protein